MPDCDDGVEETDHTECGVFWFRPNPLGAYTITAIKNAARTQYVKVDDHLGNNLISITLTESGKEYRDSFTAQGGSHQPHVLKISNSHGDNEIWRQRPLEGRTHNFTSEDGSDNDHDDCTVKIWT